MSEERYRYLLSVIRQRSAEVTEFIDCYVRSSRYPHCPLPYEPATYLDNAKRSAQLAFSAAECIEGAHTC